MATENTEASCDADPNFAVICGFFERFGAMCGLKTIDFLDLQEMLENTQEVSQELIDLHIKLLRKARKSVSSERWERALIKLCHTTYCNKDGWELERFGYKKARIGSKLRILKQLLEMQFDYNQKFKNDINKMSAEELRSLPIGRDSSGRIYWYQCDESCQIRIYKDDPDEETWSLIAKDREGLVNVIAQLNNGDSAKSSSEPVSNEDSNSVEVVVKPTLDTGQKSKTPKSTEKAKIDSDNTPTQILGTQNDDKEENDELNEDEDQNDQELTEIEESIENDENLDDETSQCFQNNEGLDLSIKSKPLVLEQPKKEFMGIKGKYIREESATISLGKAVRSASKDALSYKRPLEEDEIEEPKCIKQRRLNRPTLLIKKTEQQPKIQEESEEDEDFDDEEDENIDDEEVDDEEEEVEDEEDEEEDEEVGEEIEEPIMLIRGQGSGHSNKSCPIIVSEEIEDTFYFYGDGNGYDCQTGNESKGKDDNKTKNENTNENHKETSSCPEQSSSSFFFGSKTRTIGASLSFGASSSNIDEQSLNTDEILTNNESGNVKIDSNSKVPESVDKLDNKNVNKQEHSSDATEEIQNENERVQENEKKTTENGTNFDDLINLEKVDDKNVIESSLSENVEESLKDIENNDDIVEENPSKISLELKTESDLLKSHPEETPVSCNEDQSLQVSSSNQIEPESEAKEEDEIESLEQETKMISLQDDSTDGKIEQLERDARNISLDEENEEIEMIEVNRLEENGKKLSEENDVKGDQEKEIEKIEVIRKEEERKTEVEKETKDKVEINLENLVKIDKNKEIKDNETLKIQEKIQESYNSSSPKGEDNQEKEDNEDRLKDNEPEIEVPSSTSKDSQPDEVIKIDEEIELKKVTENINKEEVIEIKDDDKVIQKNCENVGEKEIDLTISKETVVINEEDEEVNLENVDCQPEENVLKEFKEPTINLEKIEPNLMDLSIKSKKEIVLTSTVIESETNSESLISEKSPCPLKTNTKNDDNRKESEIDDVPLVIEPEKIDSKNNDIQKERKNQKIVPKNKKLKRIGKLLETGEKEVSKEDNLVLKKNKKSKKINVLEPEKDKMLINQVSLKPKSVTMTTATTTVNELDNLDDNKLKIDCIKENKTNLSKKDNEVIEISDEIPKKRTKTDKKNPIAVINLEDQDDFLVSDGDEPELITNSSYRDSSPDREENNDRELSKEISNDDDDKKSKVDEKLEEKVDKIVNENFVEKRILRKDVVVDEVAGKKGGGNNGKGVIKDVKSPACVDVKENDGEGEEKKESKPEIVDGNIENGESSSQEPVQVRRSTRKKPGDSSVVHVELPKMKRRGKSHPSYTSKPSSTNTTQKPSEQEESPAEIQSKRSKLAENSSTLETTEKEKEDEDDEKPKTNGPFLSCVSIQKLQEPKQSTPSPPLSIKSASSNGDDIPEEIPAMVVETVHHHPEDEEPEDDKSDGDNNDDVILIDDEQSGQNDSDDCVEVTPTAKTMTLSTFQLDVTDSPPRTTEVVRKKRPRQEIEHDSGNHDDDDDEEVMSSKKRKLRGKRQVDKDLRRSIEEQKKKETISSEEDDDEKMKEKKSAGSKKKAINKGGYKRKKTLLGLDIPDIIDFTETPPGNVRQSRRIAQLKIREEAERRKIEDLTVVEVEKKRKPSKKDEDKDYKIEKVKVNKKTKSTQPEEDPVVLVQSDEDVEATITTKKKKKRRRKHVDPRKIFDECNPWRSSSDDSSSNEELAEEEEDEISDPGSPLFKSDHEFSPESDLEGGEEVQPLKRARTARKEDDCEEIDDCSCQKCGKKDHPEWILLCDGCENGWHCSCLRPALLVIPEGDWFCPPCQHIMLVKNLERKLIDFDKKLAKRQIVVRRRERLAYVGISLANVLPVKKSVQNKDLPPVLKKVNKTDEDSDSSDSESSNNEDESGSGSSESDSDDEPIYQLRQRRQAHSYRFNDYDELINSAIRDEMDAVKGAGNQGKGKDISTIVNAEDEVKDETRKEVTEEKEIQKEPVDLHSEKPESVPETTGNDQKQPEQESEEEEEDEPIKPVKKFIGRKKPRKLNCLDVSSEDDADSDEDFKGSSSDDDEDEYEEDVGSDSTDYGGRRKGPVRRSTRARRSRYDKEFINDDSDDDDEEEEKKKRKKGTHRAWTETESEESDQSWGRRKRSKKNNVSSSSPKKRKPKKIKKRFDDSDEDDRHVNKKKRKIKYGGLNDDDDETEEIGRRTRGKKINFAAVLASDSDDDDVPKKPADKLESDDDFVAEDIEQDDEDDEAIDLEELKKLQEVKNNVSNLEQSKVVIQSNVLLPQQEKLGKFTENSDSKEGGNQEEEEDEINPIEAMNRNLEEMDEEEMEKLMEEEEYANKQLQLMALQLEKEKKRKEREAQKKVHEDDDEEKTPPKIPGKRGRKPKNSNLNDESCKNLNLNESNHDSNSNINQVNNPFTEGDSPKKRRGRGKGKKTLEKEAAAAAAAAAKSTTTTSGPPAVAETDANVVGGSESSTPELQPAKLTVATPPQPFAQTQPVPSVITRMLQGGRPPGNYGQIDGFYGEQPVAGEAGPPPGNAAMPPGTLPVPPSIGQPYIQATPGNIPPSQYRPPPPPLINPFHRSSPVLPTQPQLRLRHPAPPIPPPPPPGGIYQHHTLDPSPSGGGTVGIPSTGSTPEEEGSPVTVPPASESPHGPAKMVEQSHSRQQPSQPTAAPQLAPRFGTPPVVPPPPHIRMPYQPSVQHPTSYFYMSQNMAGEENMNYPYGEQFSETNSPQEAAKGYEEENSGEFGGLVSYFSSQREDDLDT